MLSVLQIVSTNSLFGDAAYVYFEGFECSIQVTLLAYLVQHADIDSN